MSYRISIWLMFGLFIIATTVYLHRIPGLMGDEGSEGDNVYELLDKREIAVVGERSYIGPLIDYLRVPFIKLLGYTALALRLPVWLAALAAFWLVASVAKQMFGSHVSLMAVAAGLFSPAFLLESRLGWAITLLPYFAILVIWLFLSELKHKWLLAGLAAGFGLANHILFLPVLAGIIFGSALYVVPDFYHNARRALNNILGAWPALIGFWAGFGMQFVVLQIFTDDQGDTAAVAQFFSERLATLPTAWWQYLSGSVFIARYTGQPLLPLAAVIIASVISILAVSAVLLNWRKRSAWAWLGGLTVGLLVMLYMIDRHTLRYFVWLTVSLWLLAGVGLGEILSRWRERWISPIALGLAAGLSVWLAISVLLPFMQTGGSTVDFSLVDRTQSADALVDVRPLVACLRGQGTVNSENIHIFNRLQYLSHSLEDLAVVPSPEEAKWLVHYRKVLAEAVKNDCPKNKDNGLCPLLSHFCVNAQ